jgi:hypothetical protein
MVAVVGSAAAAFKIKGYCCLSSAAGCGMRSRVAAPPPPPATDNSSKKPLRVVVVVLAHRDVVVVLCIVRVLDVWSEKVSVVIAVIAAMATPRIVLSQRIS